MTATPATAIASGRRSELDLLRAAVVVGLVFFHTACIFRPEQFYVNNQESSFVLALFVFLAQLWGMPLMFLVAGGGIWHSLRSRTAGTFVRERLRRLLAPLVTGVLLVVPPQLYYAEHALGADPGSYWRFLGRFFDLQLTVGFPWVVRGAGPGSRFDIAHLWFLYYLLVYSLALLPLFVYLRRPSGRKLVERLADRCQGGWVLLLLAAPAALLEAALGTWDAGGWNNYAYLLFLAYGFLAAADRRLGAALARYRIRAVVLVVALLPVLYVIAHFDLGGAGQDLGRDYGLWSVAWRLLKAVTGCMLTAAIFGLAPSLLRVLASRWAPVAARVDGRAMSPADGRVGLFGRTSCYVHEAVLPFYVLHQTPIVIIGFYMMQWRVGIPAKYVTISLASLLVTVAVYDLGVRRARITRTLLGMRPGGG